MEFDLAQSLSVLERTPPTLRGMLHGLGPSWVDATEGPDTWSPYVIVAHLINAERTNWIPRAQFFLGHTADRRFPPFDRFAQLHEQQNRPLGDLLDEFSRLRADSLATVAGWQLTDAELGRTGEHPEFGLVTLRQLLAAWVVHDLGHVAQIARVMARQHREAVGPWRAYLPILDR